MSFKTCLYARDIVLGVKTSLKIHETLVATRFLLYRAILT